jgi:DinB superfamily
MFSDESSDWSTNYQSEISVFLTPTIYLQPVILSFIDSCKTRSGRWVSCRGWAGRGNDVVSGMKKSQIPRMPQFFDRYIQLNEDVEVLTALTETATIDCLIDPAQLHALADYVYAPGKWTVRDIVQHIIDTERIMSYRALRFARHDQTVLPGFSEELFGSQAHATRRPLADLLIEYGTVRQSSLLLFASFDESMLLRSGVCANEEISVLALGFTLSGHVRHHMQVIQTRYLPLIQGAKE